MNAPAQPLSRMVSLGASRSLISCPVCQGPMVIRTSKQVTALVKELYVVCINVGCALAAKAQISFQHEISPSGLEAGAERVLPPCPSGFLRERYVKPSSEPDPNQLDIFALADAGMPEAGDSFEPPGQPPG